MTVPRFRSTAALSTRQRRSTTQVDRATFVVFALGDRRFGVPVESVERVLRHDQGLIADASDAGLGHLTYRERQVPILALEPALALPAAATPDAATRVLVFTVHNVWVAALVRTVFEVAMVDASLVTPLDTAEVAVVGARGRFARQGAEVIVLDMLAVVRAVYEHAQRTAPRIGERAVPRTSEPTSQSTSGRE